MKKQILIMTTIIIGLSFNNVFGQGPLQDSIAKEFVGNRNENIRSYLESNSITFVCSPYFGKQLYVEGVEYEISERYTYRVMFKQGWMTNYPNNRHKNDCMNFEGFNSAIVDRVLVIEDMNEIKTYGGNDSD